MKIAPAALYALAYRHPLVGALGLFSDGEAITAVRFGAENIPFPQRPPPVLQQAARELDEYLAGEPYVTEGVWDKIVVEPMNVVIANAKQQA